MKEVVFTNVRGRAVPHQPWPQSFYVSRTLLYSDAVELRPLTFMGLLKGVGRNFIAMTYWRFMITLRILGFLKTPEIEVLRWSHFTWRFWWYQQWWRLRIVRAAKWCWRSIR